MECDACFLGEVAKALMRAGGEAFVQECKKGKQ